MAYRVLAPLVQLKVPDGAGGMVYQHFYAGAIVPDDADESTLQTNVDGGLIVDEGDAVASVYAVPAGTPLPDRPPNVAVTEGGVTAQPVPPLSDEQVAVAERSVKAGNRSNRK